MEISQDCQQQKNMMGNWNTSATCYETWEVSSHRRLLLPSHVSVPFVPEGPPLPSNSISYIYCRNMVPVCITQLYPRGNLGLICAGLCNKQADTDDFVGWRLSLRLGCCCCCCCCNESLCPGAQSLSIPGEELKPHG